jgi:hypothetical protein
MPTKARIIMPNCELEAEFFDTPCAAAIVASLPIDARPDEWGDEFYFTVPVDMPLDETATEQVTAGDIGYWPPGNALAIFFGPTPLSTGKDPVPASAVNRVGRIVGDAGVLRSCKGARTIRIE